MNDKLNALNDDMLENVVGGINGPGVANLRMEGKADPNKKTNTVFKAGSTTGGQSLLGKANPGGTVTPATRMSGGVIDDGGIKMC